MTQREERRWFSPPRRSRGIQAEKATRRHASEFCLSIQIAFPAYEWTNEWASRATGWMGRAPRVTTKYTCAFSADSTLRTPFLYSFSIACFRLSRRSTDEPFESDGICSLDTFHFSWLIISSPRVSTIFDIRASFRIPSVRINRASDVIWCIGRVGRYAARLTRSVLYRWR